MSFVSRGVIWHCIRCSVPLSGMMYVRIHACQVNIQTPVLQLKGDSKQTLSSHPDPCFPLPLLLTLQSYKKNHPNPPSPAILNLPPKHISLPFFLLSNLQTYLCFPTHKLPRQGIVALIITIGTWVSSTRYLPWGSGERG